MTVLKQLFGLPKLIKGPDALFAIKHAVAHIEADHVAGLHDNVSFLAICHALGFGNVTIDDCGCLEKRIEITHDMLATLKTKL